MLPMIRPLRLAVCVAAAVLATSSIAIAHHSHNSYEVTVWTTLEGTVREVHIMNPHSWIYLDVTDDSGATTTWSLEAASPVQIAENGVKPDFVRPGDRIRARVHLLRDGTNGALLGFITPLHGDPARGTDRELEWD